MLAGLILVAVSLVLLLYWCRYTCLLLLQTKPGSGHAGSIANAHRLAFPDVQRALAARPDQTALDALQRSLDSDLRILLYLLQHSPGLELPASEQKLLIVDYRLMQIWYRLVRRASPAGARQAVLEMSQVLDFFSRKMGERASQHAAA